MILKDYGPFASVIAIAASLAAVFSLLLLKAFGRTKQWTWLVDDTPPFLVTVGARAVAVVCIALTFIFINKSNYAYFGVAAVIVGLAAVWLIVRFDRLRKTHIYRVPLLDANGAQARDWRGRLAYKNLVIGTEDTMRPDAKKALAKARKEHGPLSLPDYLGGTGGTSLHNPGSAWTQEMLAKISSDLTLLLLGIALSTVMALYLAASIVQIAQT